MIKIKNTLVSSTIEISGNKEEEVNFNFNNEPSIKPNSCDCNKPINTNRNTCNEQTYKQKRCNKQACDKKEVKSNDCKNKECKNNKNNDYSYLYLVLSILLVIVGASR